MQSTSSLVQMEIVLLNANVAMGKVTVVIIQMNSSAVSLLSLSLLS